MKRIAENEFSEQFTADMIDLDLAYHFWLQKRYDDVRKSWTEKQKRKEEETKCLK